MDIYSMPGHLIRRLHQIHKSVFQTRMREAGYDLTSVQFAALTAIAAYPGRDQASIAGLIAHDRATMGGVIDRLEQKGLIARAVSTRDRRARELTLTPEGHAVLKDVRPRVECIQPEILPGLTDDERAEFIRLAHKAADAGNDLSRAPLVPVRNKLARGLDAVSVMLPMSIASSLLPKLNTL